MAAKKLDLPDPFRPTTQRSQEVTTNIMYMHTYDIVMGRKRPKDCFIAIRLESMHGQLLDVHQLYEGRRLLLPVTVTAKSRAG